MIDGTPRVYHYGKSTTHRFLVMDLLGKDLEELFELCGRKFSTKTVCMIANQMVNKN